MRIRHPEPNGSRRATPTNLFQHRAGHPPGAAGQDTFFLDARTATDDIWSTIVAFGTGDAVTIWGLAEAGTTMSWIDGQGAATAIGLTLHTSVANRPAMSVTLAGYTSADLSNGRLATIFGQDPNSGSDYLYIAAV